MLAKLQEPSFLKVIITLSAIAVISRAFSSISFVYYLVPLLFLLLIISGKSFVIDNRELLIVLLLLLSFGAWSILTSLWSEYPSVSLARSAGFIFISLGALIGGFMWMKMYPGSFSYLLPANLIIILLSVFSIITNIPSDSWTGGHGKGFMGFAGHQNTLASALVFTLPGLIKQKYDVKKKSDLIFIGLISINLVILLLTYSRASVLTLIAGVICFLILSKKWRILLFTFTASALIVFIINMSPILKQKSTDILNKDFPEFYSTRLWMWEPSYNAALSGGLTGLGYGMSDPDILLPGSGSYYEGDRYVREKGNSGLALIEETGIIGLLLFVLSIGYVLVNKKPMPLNNQSTIIKSILIALIIHAQFEAWWVGVGSIHLPMFYFYLGQAAVYKTA